MAFPIENNEQSLDFNLPALVNTITNIAPNTMGTSLSLIDSTALLNLSATVLKNAPYAFNNHFDISYEIAAKSRYFESALISLVCIVHNFVMGTLFTLATICTLGMVKELNNSMKKHWVHTAMAVASFGISFVGIASGRGATGATVFLYLGIIVIIARNFQSDGNNLVRNIFQNHGEAIEEGVVRVAEGLRMHPHQIQNINGRIREVQNLDDLRGIANLFLAQVGQNENIDNDIDHDIHEIDSDEESLSESDIDLVDDLSDIDFDEESGSDSGW